MQGFKNNLAFTLGKPDTRSQRFKARSKRIARKGSTIDSTPGRVVGLSLHGPSIKLAGRHKAIPLSSKSRTDPRATQQKEQQQTEDADGPQPSQRDVLAKLQAGARFPHEKRPRKAPDLPIRDAAIHAEVEVGVARIVVRLARHERPEQNRQNNKPRANKTTSKGIAVGKAMAFGRIAARACAGLPTVVTDYDPINTPADKTREACSEQSK